MLNSAGLLDHKKELISWITDGRTDSSRQLTRVEYFALVDYLRDHDTMHRMRRKVFTLARKAGIIYGTTLDDRKMNKAKLDTFLKSRGTVKKPLNDLTQSELSKVIRQFEAILKSNEKSAHSKEVKSVLEELKIEVR